MAELLRRFLLWLARASYDEPAQLRRIAEERAKVVAADRRQRDAVMRAEAARALARFVRTLG